MAVFDDLMTDTISILKQDGSSFDGVKASVSSKSIHIDRPDILIEPGDIILRKMSNGGEETFEVIDPGFQEKFAGLDAHYQTKVRKLGLPEARRAVQSVTVNVTGPNARVNAHSIDNSTNVYSSNPDIAEHLAALRIEVEKLGDIDVIEVVDAIEGQFSSGKPSKTVVKTLLGGLPGAGSIASIGSFLLSCLG